MRTPRGLLGLLVLVTACAATPQREQGVTRVLAEVRGIT